MKRGLIEHGVRTTTRTSRRREPQNKVGHCLIFSYINKFVNKLALSLATKKTKNNNFIINLVGLNLFKNNNILFFC